MNSYMTALIIAAVAGIAMALQGSLNSILGKTVGLLETTFIVHIVGLLAIGILFALQVGEGNLGMVTKAPWYTLPGGILGVMIVYGVAASIPAVGVAAATTAIIVCQLAAAAVIDHWGLFGLQTIHLNWYRAGGLLVLITGAYLMLVPGNR